MDVILLNEEAIGGLIGASVLTRYERWRRSRDAVAGWTQSFPVFLRGAGQLPLDVASFFPLKKRSLHEKSIFTLTHPSLELTARLRLADPVRTNVLLYTMHTEIHFSGQPVSNHVSEIICIW